MPCHLECSRSSSRENARHPGTCIDKVEIGLANSCTRWSVLIRIRTARQESEFENKTLRQIFAMQCLEWNCSPSPKQLEKWDWSADDQIYLPVDGRSLIKGAMAAMCVCVMASPHPPDLTSTSFTHPLYLALLFRFNAKNPEDHPGGFLAAVNAVNFHLLLINIVVFFCPIDEIMIFYTHL